MPHALPDANRTRRLCLLRLGKGERVAKGQGKQDKQAAAVKVTSSETLFQGRVFALNRDHIFEPGGIEAVREVIVHPGSVVVLTVFPDGRILLIRQYRHAAKQYMWELVAGHREEHETFLEAAPRELQEETGYTARRFTKLLDIYSSPGLLSEKMEIYLAQDLTKGKAKPEEDEKITTRILTLAEVEKWINTGKIVDSKTVAGVLYYAKFVAGKRKKPVAAKKRKKA
jgi:ADP-ribose pyrophosphatase